MFAYRRSSIFFSQPGVFSALVPAPRGEYRRARTVDQQSAQVTITTFIDAEQLLFPPLDCCFGTTPSHAAICRPFLKLRASALGNPLLNGSIDMSGLELFAVAQPPVPDRILGKAPCFPCHSVE
jgi:hypothetical protein